METYFAWMLQSLLPLTRGDMKNRLYYGDNLPILGEKFEAETMRKAR
jgi:hypothetical protein